MTLEGGNGYQKERRGYWVSLKKTGKRTRKRVFGITMRERKGRKNGGSSLCGWEAVEEKGEEGGREEKRRQPGYLFAGCFPGLVSLRFQGTSGDGKGGLL